MAGEWTPVAISLTVGAAATLASVPPAIFVAWYLERSRLPGRAIVQTAVMLPLVLPPVVVGYVLLRLFSPHGALGRSLAAAGCPVAFAWAGAVVAAAVVGFPLLVMMISLAMKAVDPRLELTSRCLGHSEWSTFWRITLPLAWPGMLGGAAIAFARGLGEFGATIVLAGRIPGQTDTIALRIHAELYAVGGETRIGGLVVASILIGLGAVIAARLLDQWHRRRLELER